MSTYGTYINGEDPNKKKDPKAVGATTPTIPPVLTYEGFIGTGTGSNAYQQGVKYAQGVKDSIYGSAKALREQTEKNIENARQRGIVDSKSSYQKAVGTYGANAEALGKMGLTESGYGEYLTADAYATHRGNVQDINAQAVAANREAANLEAQTKAAADSEYLKNLYSLGTEFDAAKDTAYNDIITAISEGTSLDVVKQSGEWGDLTLEQQNAIKAEADKIAGEKTEATDNYASYVAEEALGDGIASMDALNSFLNTYTDAEGNILSNDMREKITAKWQSDSAERVIKNISNASVTENGIVYNGEEYSGIDIANDIKNGVYGDNAQAVVDAYCEFIYNNLDKFLNLPGGASYAYSQASNIGPLANEWAKKIITAINQKTGYTSSTTSSTKPDGSVYSAAGINVTSNPFPGGK